MAGRIASVRKALQASLKGKMPNKDWEFITRQIGMFSFTGMVCMRHCAPLGWMDGAGPPGPPLLRAPFLQTATPQAFGFLMKCQHRSPHPY